MYVIPTTHDVKISIFDDFNDTGVNTGQCIQIKYCVCLLTLIVLQNVEAV